MLAAKAIKLQGPTHKAIQNFQARVQECRKALEDPVDAAMVHVQGGHMDHMLRRGNAPAMPLFCHPDLMDASTAAYMTKFMYPGVWLPSPMACTSIRISHPALRPTVHCSRYVYTDRMYIHLSESCRIIPGHILQGTDLAQVSATYSIHVTEHSTMHSCNALVTLGHHHPGKPCNKQP